MQKETKLIINVSRRLLLYTNNTEKQIAKMLHISETTLRSLYLSTFNMPPRRYIRNIKLKKAQTMLRTTTEKISNIAYAIGYINTSKFTEAFKQIYGVTPSQYRKNCGFGVE